MPTGRQSLLAGRNKDSLSEHDVRRAINTFIGMDPNVNVRYDEGSSTHFHVVKKGGVEYGEVVVGTDIYPGSGVADPNSTLSLDAAVAHELTHYYRWRDKSELSDRGPNHLDEALTSLEAALRYEKNLNNIDIRQLVSDSLQRLHLHIEEMKSVADSPGGKPARRPV